MCSCFLAALSSYSQTSPQTKQPPFPYVVRAPRLIQTNSALIEVQAPAGTSIAYLLDSRDFQHAQWGAAASVTITGLKEGENKVWIGFRNQAAGDYWTLEKIIVDSIPPQIVVTNPPITDLNGTVVTIPMIQIEGYANEALSSVSFSFANSVTSAEKEAGIVQIETVDQVTRERRVPFKCLDIDLARGTNHIFISVVDRAGNEALYQLNYVLDYTQVTAGPKIISKWPNDGIRISGSRFTLRGYLNDPTAEVSATIAGGGRTNKIDGEIERDGLFWVENLPLAAGENRVTLLARNAVGLQTTESFTVVQSPLKITRDRSPESLFIKRFADVTGTISDNSYTVWVNGVKAIMHDDGTWSATRVRVKKEGTATFHIVAIPNSDNNGDGTPPPPGPVILDNVRASANPSSPEAVAAGGW